VHEVHDSGQWAREDVDQRYALLTELGDCHAAMSEDPAAHRCYREACQIAPEKTDAYVGLGALEARRGQFGQARRSFEIARHLDPTCAKAYGGLAMVLHQQRDYPAAFEMYLKCLELDTDDLMALLGLFQTSCQMGTFAQIIHYLEVYLSTHPDDTAVLFCLATLLAREGDLDSAGRSLRRVLELEPGKVEAAQLLAQVTDSMARARPQEAVLA
jgi:Flp pilus assembly protein TadD